MSAGIGLNVDDPKDENLYMIVYDKVYDEAFKVAKAGDYYYLNTKLLFDNLDFPYETETISFEMSRVPDEEPSTWKLKRNLKTTKTETNAEKTED